MTNQHREPCPFCGGTADLVVSDPNDGQPSVGQPSVRAVHCIACRAWGPSILLKTQGDETEVWALWNQRSWWNG